jgi:hypothetical protein
MSKIFNLNDLKKREAEKNNDDDEQYFAGGLDGRGYVTTCSVVI